MLDTFGGGVNTIMQPKLSDEAVERTGIARRIEAKLEQVQQDIKTKRQVDSCALKHIVDSLPASCSH